MSVKDTKHNAANLILRQKKALSYNPFLIDLHWLPVKFCIEINKKKSNPQILFNFSENVAQSIC